MKSAHLQTIYTFNYIVISFLAVLRFLDIYSTSVAVSSGIAYETNILARAFFENGNITELVLLNIALLTGLLLLNYYSYLKEMIDILYIIFAISILISVLSYIVVYQNYQILNA